MTTKSCIHLPGRQTILLCLALFLPHLQHGQPRIVTLEEAVQLALTQNPGLKAAASETSAARYHKQTSSEIPKTQVLWMNGQFNSLNTDNNISLMQSIPFPTVFTSQSKLGEKQVESSLLREATSRNQLIYRIRSIHQDMLYLLAQESLLLSQDTLFTEMVRITDLQLKTGEGTLLQHTAAQTRYNEVRNLLRQNKSDQLALNAQLEVLIHSDAEVTFSQEPLTPLTTTLLNDSALVSNNPVLALQESLRSVALLEKRVEANRALPDLTIGYFTQSLIGFQTQSDGTDRYFTSDDRFTGFTLGLAIPIWFVPSHAKIKAAGARSDAMQYQTLSVERQLYSAWHQATQEFHKHHNSLEYYGGSALPSAKLLLQQSLVAIRAGEIGQAEYRLNVQQALSIREGYLQTVLAYNQSILTLEFLAGEYVKQ